MTLFFVVKLPDIIIYRSSQIFQPAVNWSGHDCPGWRVAHRNCKYQYVCPLLCLGQTNYILRMTNPPIGQNYVCQEKKKANWLFFIFPSDMTDFLPTYNNQDTDRARQFLFLFFFPLT